MADNPKKKARRGRPFKKGDREVDVEILRAKAVELKVTGMGYEAIGKALDVSVATAHNYVHEHLRRINDGAANNARDHRDTELAQVDKAIAAILPAAEKGDPKAIDCLMRCLTRRARYSGSELPQLHEVAVKDESKKPKTVDNRLREFLESRGIGLPGLPASTPNGDGSAN